MLFSKTNTLKILFVEDNPDHVLLIQGMLNEISEFQLELEHKDHLIPALDVLDNTDFDLVLLDFSLPDCQGLDILIKVKTQFPELPIIVVSALDDEDIAIKALQTGAQDYLVKGQIDAVLLGRSIRYAIERERAEVALRKTHQELKQKVQKRTTDLKKKNKELQRKNQIQTVLNKILHISLMPYSLKAILEIILEQLVSIDWLALQAKGAVFLVEDESEMLIMKACYGFPEKLKEMCEQVPFGRCICGRVASTKKSFYTGCLDERHENSYENLSPHGHYCVPILSSDKVLGVLNLALKEGHSRNKDEENFLQSIAHYLAEIIERKQVEEALKRERSKVEKYLDIAGVMIVVINTDHTVSLINKKGCEILGFGCGGIGCNDVIGKKWFDNFLPERTRDRAKAAFDKLVAGDVKSVKYYEGPVLTKDGQERILSWHNSILKNERGEVIGILSSGEDITDRKKAEQELRKLQRAIEQSPETIMITDYYGNIEYINPKFTQLTGYPAEEVLGKNPSFLKSGKQSEEFYRQLWDTIRSGKDWHGEFYNQKKDGEYYWESASISPVTNEDGIITHFVAVKEDVSERKKREREREKLLNDIKESEEKYHKLVETANDAIFIADAETGVIIDANKKAEELVGRPVEEIIGMHQTELHPKPEDNPSLYQTNFNRAIQSRKNIEVGVYALHKDGRKIPIEIAGSVTNINGRKVILRIFRDISERKRAEIELERAFVEIEQLKNRLQAENIYLQNEIKVEHNFEEIIGQSERLQEVLKKVEQVAPTSSTVLIAGETGTGKELFARAIHSISERKMRPLVKVNCAALPSNLIESELFGHEKGAFTGALTAKSGRFELADGGTIFLDEIGDLPIELQSKLLRVLQEGEFERVGSSKTTKVDVRVIAATNRKLADAIDSGAFRSDLFYRLNVFPIVIPPLRDRKDDIHILANHFVNKYSAKVGKKINTILLETISALQAYHWPGNVRELENIIERAVVLCKSPILQIDELVGHSSGFLKPSGYLPSLKENERLLIHRALQECKWIIKGKHGAAARLDIPPSTLRDRIKRYGLSKPC